MLLIFNRFNVNAIKLLRAAKLVHCPNQLLEKKLIKKWFRYTFKSLIKPGSICISYFWRNNFEKKSWTLHRNIADTIALLQNRQVPRPSLWRWLLVVERCSYIYDYSYNSCSYIYIDISLKFQTCTIIAK